MLQGSLDNFALDEVLNLLSSTSKTGHLQLEGDRGKGSLVLRDGKLVDVNATKAPAGAAPEDVVFELLRYKAGNFSFDSREVDVVDGAADVLDVLAAAEGRLADWRTIEAVVPSLGHTVSPVVSLPADEVTLNRSEWTVLTAAAGGRPVEELCEQLGVGEVDGSRQIKNLVERGLATIGVPGERRQPAAPRSSVESLSGLRPNASAPPPPPAANASAPAVPPAPPAPVVAAAPAAAAPGPLAGAGGGAPAPVAGAGAPGAAPAVAPVVSVPFERRTTISDLAPPDDEPLRPQSPPAPPAPTSALGDSGSVPPVPPAPTAADLDQLRSGETVDRRREPETGADDKPGGLLMRYLKSEE